MIGQGSTALAVGAGGVVWTLFSHLPFLSSFSLSLGDGPILTKIISLRAVTPKQPSNQNDLMSIICLRKSEFLLKEFQCVMSLKI